MKQILFFATPSDVVPLLERFQANSPLQFVEIGTLPTPDRETYLDAGGIPDPGIATHETGSLSKGYQVSKRGTVNQVRSSITKKGEKRWNLFNADTEETITLSMGGIWKTGTLLPGSVATVHGDATAQQLMKWFQLALKEEGFTKIRNWWVGKDAMKRLMAGERLATTAEQSPPEYDLRSTDAPAR
jgi:hypothetical protein